MKSMWSKFGLIASAVCLFALTMAQAASASLKIDAKDFTEPVETSLGEAVPIVAGFVAVIFGVGFVIRWILKRAHSAS